MPANFDPTGLYYNRGRYYNPNTGRFAERDSLMGDLNNPLSLNRYSYAQNNPTDLTDPSGNQTAVQGPPASSPIVEPPVKTTPFENEGKGLTELCAIGVINPICGGVITGVATSCILNLIGVSVFGHQPLCPFVSAGGASASPPTYSTVTDTFCSGSTNDQQPLTGPNPLPVSASSDDPNPKPVTPTESPHVPEPTTKSQPNRGVLQIQGKDLAGGNLASTAAAKNTPADIASGESYKFAIDKKGQGTLSWNWNRNGPISASEGLRRLQDLWLMLNTRQQNDRTKAYADASTFIQKGPTIGGIYPPGKSDFHNVPRPAPDTRIDVQVNLGIAFNIK